MTPGKLQPACNRVLHWAKLKPMGKRTYSKATRKKALRLRKEGRSYSEISAATGAPTGTVKAWVRRGVAQGVAPKSPSCTGVLQPPATPKLELVKPPPIEPDEVIEKPKRKGRRSKLTNEVRDGLAEIVREGVPYTLACAQWGIVPQTVRNWRERGLREINEGRSTIYTRFFDAIALAELDAIRAGMAAAKGDHRAATHFHWWAERRHRAHFGLKQQIEHTVQPKPVDLSVLSEDQVGQLAERALARREGKE